MLKAGKMSHLIKDLKQSNKKDQAKAAKKGETSGKEKPLAILMVQPLQRVAKQNITQTFSPKLVISFSPLGVEDGMEGPMIIEAEIGGHFFHRMYVDGGSSSKILYEHCFNRFRPEVKSQMVYATTSLVGFSEEIIWPLGQISLLVKIGDEEHSTSAWINFMIDYSIRMYNGFRTRNAVAHNQPSHTRKDSGSDPPRIFRANYSNRLHFDRRSTEGAMQPAKVQPRYIRLEASRYD
nr:reverse transcriptase domain-containing protein [Tanacetum cinerariifolium]